MTDRAKKPNEYTMVARSWGNDEQSRQLFLPIATEAISLIVGDRFIVLSLTSSHKH
ncbi:hypothetical protein [Spirulina sp. 06S082]|uniref:hypothetical protein n=1 Tax=Spirulina sp. 06S082 TaxID=3110248 RepID=UPI002B1F504F|nr:hypothetical protein [Spirulina sp. 06S082]MEA5470587.1 hypothetical protein [Spirulina sp. 06S082]